MNGIGTVWCEIVRRLLSLIFCFSFFVTTSPSRVTLLNCFVHFTPHSDQANHLSLPRRSFEVSVVHTHTQHPGASWYIYIYIYSPPLCRCTGMCIGSLSFCREIHRSRNTIAQAVLQERELHLTYPVSLATKKDERIYPLHLLTVQYFYPLSSTPPPLSSLLQYLYACTV